MRKIFIIFVGVAVIMQFTWIGYAVAAGVVTDSDWTGETGTNVETGAKIKLALEDDLAEKVAAFAVGDPTDINLVTAGASTRLSTGDIGRAWARQTADNVQVRVHDETTSLVDLDILDFPAFGGTDCIVNINFASIMPRNDGGFVVTAQYIEKGTQSGSPLVNVCGGLLNEDVTTIAAVYDKNFNAIVDPIDVNSSICAEVGNQKKCGFQQNSTTVGVFDDNSFVVVWSDLGIITGNMVYTQHYAADGTPIGTPISIDTDFGIGESDELPSVAVLPNQNYVVVWDSYSDRGDVYFQIMDKNGNKIGTNVKVTVAPVGVYAYYSNLAFQSDNDFIISYSYGSGADWPVYFRIYNSAGAAKTGSIAIDGESGADQWKTDIAVGEQDEFVVVYTDWKYSGVDYDLALKRFDADGNQLDAAVRIVTDFNDTDLSYPSIVYAGADDYWITWRAKSDNNAYTVKWGRDYFANGEYVSDKFTIPAGNAWISANWDATVPTGTSLKVEVDTDGNGTFEEVTNGEDLYGASLDSEPKESTELTYRLTFATTDGDLTPALDLISFGYEDLLVLVGSNKNVPLALAFVSGLLLTMLWYNREKIYSSTARRSVK